MSLIRRLLDAIFNHRDSWIAVEIGDYVTIDDTGEYYEVTEIDLENNTITVDRWLGDDGD